MRDRNVQRATRRLVSLAPTQRLLGGGLLAVAGVALFVSSQRRGTPAMYPISLLLSGLLVGLLAWGDLRRQRRLERQMARAKAELPVLRQLLTSSPGQGVNPTQLLQQRGYSEFFVRRWILNQLDDLA